MQCQMNTRHSATEIHSFSDGLITALCEVCAEITICNRPRVIDFLPSVITVRARNRPNQEAS